MALASLLAASGACSGGPETPAPQATASEVALQVRNECGCTVTVYLLRAGQRTRIGTVRGSSTETFSLPQQSFAPTGEIELLADQIGSKSVGRTERLVVRPGQYIVWTLAADLSRSSVAVFE